MNTGLTMSRIKSISAQIQRSKDILPKIEEKYNKSLSSKSIDEGLKLDIQSYCTHLRSALDYLAKDIVDSYCPTANPKNNLYFPITSDAKSFHKKMKNSYPGLKQKRKSVYDYLESIQPYQTKENIWLTHFNKVNNENKHENLVEQTKSESKRVNVDIHGGGKVNWNPSSVKFGRGVYIGGVPVNPITQMPEPSPSQTVTIETWVDFRFEGINVSALLLLKKAGNEIENIVDKINKEL